MDSSDAIRWSRTGVHTAAGFFGNVLGTGVLIGRSTGCSSAWSNEALSAPIACSSSFIVPSSNCYDRFRLPLVIAQYRASGKAIASTIVRMTSNTNNKPQALCVIRA
jgi:hypothetical protein